MTPRYSILLAKARELVERPDPMTVGIWPRATALLARQALEGALDSLWRSDAPGLDLCSARAQFICLPTYLPNNRDLAERSSYAWFSLSRACHHRLHELPPTSSELLSWITTIEELVVCVESVRSRSSRRRAKQGTQ